MSGGQVGPASATAQGTRPRRANLPLQFFGVVTSGMNFTGSMADNSGISD